jgi:hypothetical protein
MYVCIYTINNSYGYLSTIHSHRGSDPAARGLALCTAAAAVGGTQWEPGEKVAFYGDRTGISWGDTLW